MILEQYRHARGTAARGLHHSAGDIGGILHNVGWRLHTSRVRLDGAPSHSRPRYGHAPAKAGKDLGPRGAAQPGAYSQNARTSPLLDLGRLGEGQPAHDPVRVGAFLLAGRAGDDVVGL